MALRTLPGTNMICTGDKLPIAANAGDSADAAQFTKLSLKPIGTEEPIRGKGTSTYTGRSGPVIRLVATSGALQTGTMPGEPQPAQGNC